ncbi:MAG: aminomethyltransferase family protein [Phycisphaerae bacterium]|nr:aminomethyltransferase family protein [Phycisphaerae bacterium]
MARISPLLASPALAGSLVRAYGPEEATVGVVEVVDQLEAEYAALRRSCVVLDLPQRGTLRVSGPDRLPFLNRMLTQDLRTLPDGSCRRSFWLTRKGRIDADLRVLAPPRTASSQPGWHVDETILDLDVHAVERTKTGLASYIIADDVAIEDATGEFHRLALHGPAAPALLERCDPAAGAAAAQPGAVFVAVIDGARVLVDRQDSAGEPGFELLIATAEARRVFEALLESGGFAFGTQRRGGDALPRIRPAGWHAYNIARIEAGWPVYHLDFGPNSLPHESGVLHDRVSFTKGCYLGQEIVARMQSLGHPKQRLVGLDVESRAAPLRADGPPSDPIVPDTGSAIVATAEPDSPTIGAVTSAALSPMLGSRPIAFAMVRHEQSAPGTCLIVHAADAPLNAKVRDSLTFWHRP